MKNLSCGTGNQNDHPLRNGIVILSVNSWHRMIATKLYVTHPLRMELGGTYHFQHFCVGQHGLGEY